MLPPDVESIIIDYYWSQRMYLQRKELHGELLMNFFFKEVRSFYDLYRTLSIYVIE